MNPDTHFNLPPPIREAQPPAPSEQGETAQDNEQLQAGSPEAAASQAPQAVPTAPPPQDDRYAPMVALDAPASQMATASQTAGSSDDAVALDKSWIVKAKQIVAQTADNPFEQNRQLAYVKADYLEKRYGKIIKVAE